MDRGYPCGSLLPDFVITLNVRAFLLFLETCNGDGNDFGIKVMYQIKNDRPKGLTRSR